MWGEMVLFFLFCLVTIPPITHLFHEMGHLLMAKIMLVPGGNVVIGKGKVLFSFSFFETTFHIHQWFFLGGSTTFASVDKIPVWRRCLIYLGGPLMNGLCAFALLTPGFGYAEHWTTVWFQWLLLMNIWVCIVNLIPFQQRGKKSDGKLFIETIQSVLLTKMRF